MKSEVAETLDRERREREASLEAGERVALALALGARDLLLYASAHGISPREARIRLRRLAQRGRTPSACAGG
ncbi:MAG: hypothetical protein H6738_24645 [Alphaproteobacteria bacterium]|nr:hypothetical protein [Myxococcales bacterium]MCB9690091.1 hypothetical protein [Alphaproteobacteria bacterium]MCB9700000.1 hypothetical protein [Alphaproteobacteria bacterium]